MLVQIDDRELLGQVGGLNLLPTLSHAGLVGSFIRFDVTSEDLALAINGVPITRVLSDGVGNLPYELNRPEVASRLASAVSSYSEAKVESRLNYSADTDYRLSELPKPKEKQSRFNPYYAYHRIMGMTLDEFKLKDQDLTEDADPEAIFARKREVIDKLCLENEATPPNGYGYKRLKREIEDVTLLLKEGFKKRVNGEILDVMIDEIAQRYTPETSEDVKAAVSKIAAIFKELYAKGKNRGVLLPKDQQLLTFFSQVAKRAFGETEDLLKMFVVACPRYGEHDEYDRLEEGLSQTANTYLQTLPLLTTVLSKNGIPFTGQILVNDSEEQMADGALLKRLGLSIDTYNDKCRANVEAINQAIAGDEELVGISAHLFTDIFPEFVDVTANLERQLYHLAQADPKLKLDIAKSADARLDRHRKIMGGECDFSDSLYLAYHYSAEYMALGYLCRLYPELSSDSFIVNYNSPNVELFNSQAILTKSVKGDAVKGVNTIPVFQVKYY